MLLLYISRVGSSLVIYKKNSFDSVRFFVCDNNDTRRKRSIFGIYYFFYYRKGKNTVLISVKTGFRSDNFDVKDAPRSETPSRIQNKDKDKIKIETNDLRNCYTIFLL